MLDDDKYSMNTFLTKNDVRISVNSNNNNSYLIIDVDFSKVFLWSFSAV